VTAIRGLDRLSAAGAPPAAAPPVPAVGANGPGALPNHSPKIVGLSVVFIAFLAMLMIEYTGLGFQIPAIRLLRVSTILAYGALAAVVWRVGPIAFTEYRQSRLLSAIVVMTGLSILWAVVRSYVPLSFRFMFDYYCLFVITTYLVNSQKRIDLMSFAFVAVLVKIIGANLDKFGGERSGIFTAGYFMGDGNDFSWAICTLLPFALNLMFGKRSILTRCVGLLGTAAAMLGMVGPQSRGATLALGAAVLYYWLFISRRKLLGVVVVVALAVGVVVLAPSGYVNRVQSIQNYEEDTSAMYRIRAWKGALKMAIDFPLGVGAGNFSTAYGRYYMDRNAEGFGALRWISAHSVYFKILGEYGYPGLILFLIVLFSCLRDNGRSARHLRAMGGTGPLQEPWPHLLNLGIVAYAVAATFLGGIAYPHIFILSGMTVATTRIVDEARRARLQSATASVGSSHPAPASAPPAPALPKRLPLGPRPANAGPGRFF
jgi:O-antigen ligase